jgi:hypothetical protein
MAGSAGLLTASAAGSSNASSFVPITPCRLMDTRAASNVGPRATPITGGETYSALVWGTNGDCTIPATATAVSLNVTFVNPSSPGFVTVYPPDKPWPGTSNLNFVAGQAPAPNGVISPLSADGKIGFYNFIGTVDLVADIAGYYEPSTSAGGPTGPAGAQGPIGPTGPQGPTGPSGLAPIDLFTPTQIVQGAILTCASTSADATSAGCQGILLNGIGLSINSYLASANAICNTVTGSTAFIGVFGAVTATPKFQWNGTDWIVDASSAQVTTGIWCHL